MEKMAEETAQDVKMKQLRKENGDRETNCLNLVIFLEHVVNVKINWLRSHFLFSAALYDPEVVYIGHLFTHFGGESHP